MNTVLSLAIVAGFPLALIFMGKLAHAKKQTLDTLKAIAGIWSVAGAAGWAAATNWPVGALLMVFIALLITAADLRAANREVQ